ncbi:MAG: class I SAM-dependent RNA methyltransferase [Acidobacteriota bacterium]|nr:class I SAM-dependent RNA methyltransferase [Acidobacteriota bacterium]
MNNRHESENFLEVRIEKIVPNGFGLAFAEDSTVFVALAAKGDKLRVKINRRKGKTAFAEIVEIVKPSPDRTEPRCPYFGTCGGCNFQQLKYEAQLEAKVEIIRDCLSRIGKINYEREIPVIGSPRFYEYRSRAQWHVDVRGKKVGYFKGNSHDVIDVEVCPILVPEMQSLLTELRETIVWESFSGRVVEIEAAASGEDVSIYSSEIVEPTDEISFKANGNRYFYDADTFFQGNQFLIEPLIKTATNGAAGETALDLYCGVGLFTLPLAKNFTKVLGVEGYKKALDFAAKAIENARIENVGFFGENVGEWLTENLSTLGAVNFVLLDPPRSGTEKETIEGLLELKPDEISYVSCDPAILARDLRLLTETAYRIESITAIDLFPQTHHIETIVRLKLKS